jgi:hypothetical protein
LEGVFKGRNMHEVEGSLHGKKEVTRHADLSKKETPWSGPALVEVEKNLASTSLGGTEL